MWISSDGTLNANKALRPHRDGLSTQAVLLNVRFASAIRVSSKMQTSDVAYEFP